MPRKVIAEYKVGKAVYQVTPEGFIDNINPLLPGLEIVYPWDSIYASLEYEKVEDRRTGLPEPILRWMRVYQRGGPMLAEMAITDDLRPAMLRFYELFKETQAAAEKSSPKQ